MRFLPLYFALSTLGLYAQEKPALEPTGNAAKLQWFKDAKLGIFIYC